MKETNSGIYCFENILDGEKYIGQAADIDTRIKNHQNLLRKCKDVCIAFQRAWSKYGEENFIYYEVERCCIDSLNDREKYWIKELHSHITDHGYNVSWGGDSFFRGLHHTEDAKRRISENSGTPMGEANYMTGRERTPEEKESISLGLIEYYKTHVGQVHLESNRTKKEKVSPKR